MIMQTLGFVQNIGVIELTVVLLPLAFWAWMIVDCVRNERGTQSKLVWLLLILLVGIVAAPAYFFMRVVPRWGGGRPSASG